MRVLVIGGGIIGVASALALRSHGADVVIIERGEIGGEASSVAAGILGAQVEAHDGESDDALFARVKARDDYAAWCGAIEAKSSQKTGYLRGGVISIARDDDELAATARHVTHQRALGLRVDALTQHELRRLEPQIANDAIGGAYFPDDAQVEPARLMRALAALLAPEGVRVVRDEVTSLSIAKDRVEGVCTKNAEIRADFVIACAGAFTSMLAPRDPILPAVEPVRGELVTVRDEPARLSHVIFGAGGYVVPRGDGRVVCGTTEERVGFERGPTTAGIERVKQIARAIAPHLENAPILTATSNFRPFVMSGPVVAATRVKHLFVATGHHRNGILLAKWTADTIATLVLRS